MVEDVFQRVDELMALLKRTMEIVQEAFVVANGLQKEANVGNVSNNEDELPRNIEVDHETLRGVAFEDVVL
jgi:hypothetical protein